MPLRFNDTILLTSSCDHSVEKSGKNKNNHEGYLITPQLPEQKSVFKNEVDRDFAHKAFRNCVTYIVILDFFYLNYFKGLNREGLS